MNENFSNRTAVVTGSSGIGLGCALRLAELGAQVYLCGIDEGYNDAARKQAAGLSVEVIQVDVGREDGIKALANRIADERGHIHTLVNAAAIQPYGTIETTSPADWDRVMQTNLRSCYLTSHVFYPLMKGRPDASIIHLASVQGHCNQRNVLAYATSKGAIHALTRAMAVDSARDGVRVNSISPGSIGTPLLEFAAQELTPPGGNMEDTLKGFGASHPVGRIGTVEEVAALVVFLAGGQSGFCTGSDYAIDGGLRAQLGV